MRYHEAVSRDYVQVTWATVCQLFVVVIICLYYLFVCIFRANKRSSPAY